MTLFDPMSKSPLDNPRGLPTLHIVRPTPPGSPSVRDPNRRENREEHIRNGLQILELAVEAGRPLDWDETKAVLARLSAALEAPK